MESLNPDSLESYDDLAIAFLLQLEAYIPHFHTVNLANGRFGYRKQVEIYRDGKKAGIACFDGNNNTMLISLTGTGTSGVDMVRLRDFISRLDEIKITRIDLAHDDLEGQIPIDKFIEHYESGQFTLRGKAPSRRLIDDFGSGKGQTFYVGNKANGKEACIYEKGKQLGDSLSPWVRSEVRLTSVDRVIPLETMTNPAAFMAGSYPVFRRLSYFCERVQVIKKQAKIAFDSLCSYAAVAYGGLINAMSEIGMSDGEIVQKLKRDTIPKRLVLPFPPEQVAA